MKTQIINGKVVLPSRLEKTNILIDNGVITSISAKAVKDNTIRTIDATGKVVLPGFIDLHTNGIGGFDLTNGVYDPVENKFSIRKEAYKNELNNALRNYASTGTTLVGFTTLEASIKKLKKIFSYIAEYKNSYKSILKDIIHGIYMEGTFMKVEEYKGAHNPKYFFKPSIRLFEDLQRAAEGNIRIVNVVPEWGGDAIKLIRYLTKNNILCAAGHTSANGEEYNRAIGNGLKLAIHVLNGPSSTSFKPFDYGGALESLLRSDKMSVEIIPDGYHVDKSYLMDIIKRKGIDKCIAISDSMFITNMKKVKQFSINGVTGKLSKNGEYIQIAGKEDTNSLFGSTLTMDKAFSNLLTWFTQPVEGIWNSIHPPLKYDEAIVAASRMCSFNPARILNINPVQQINDGSIEKGNKANIVVGDIAKNESGHELLINQVLLNGNTVFPK